jgi:hypothetical protein
MYEKLENSGGWILWVAFVITAETVFAKLEKIKKLHGVSWVK